MGKMIFEPTICPHCHQSMEYVLAIDRGTTDILKAVATAIGRKGVNAIHPRKEMETHDGISYREMVEQGQLSSNQVGNLSRARFHGLIARIKGNPGNYCLTHKGASFLRGEPIPRFAIISKAEKKNVGYFDPENQKVRISDFKPDQEYWTGIGYEISEGNLIQPKGVQQTKLI